jgi:predicted RNA-binding protein with PUA-like domain
MNVWILQDEPGVRMRSKIEKEGTSEPWWWNVDRYIKSSTHPHIEEGDKVLLWQPNLDDANPAGIYAVGEVVNPPYFFPNEKSSYRIDFKITKVLHRPITREVIKSNRLLSKMQIIRMAGGHIVFRVEPSEWEELKRVSRESLD